MQSSTVHRYIYIGLEMFQKAGMTGMLRLHLYLPKIGFCLEYRFLHICDGKKDLG